MVRAEGEKPKAVTVGDDDLNASTVAYLEGMLRAGETLAAVSGFSFGEKTLAITDQRILVAEEEGSVSRLTLDVTHDDILRFERDGRTLIIEPRQTGERRYKFGQDQTVEQLVKIARSHQTTQTQVEGSREIRGAASDGGQSSIAERVRFWEEQDKINQELIPRVIRQNELLTKHIAEHDSLPEVAGRAISEALAGAREEHRQQYEAAMEVAKKEFSEAREEQRQQYEVALGAARRELAEQAQVTLDQTLATVRQDMQHQYDAALELQVRELAQQGQAQLDQTLAVLRQEAQKTRKVLIGIATVAVAAGVAAPIVGLLT